MAGRATGAGNTSSVDVVVIGGGHNALVAAAYLARAGRSVRVLERRESLGGTAGTEELAPGIPAPVCFSSAERFHPSIVRDLDLASHGLELLPTRGGTFLPGGPGGGLLLPSGSAEQIAGAISEQCSADDAAAFLELDGFLTRLGSALEPVFTQPLPDLEPVGIRNSLDLLNLGWRLRSLGRKEMPEALRFLPMPVRDVVEERFRAPSLQAAIAGPALAASWHGPRSAGSALGLLQHRPTWSGGLFAPTVFPRGGMGALIEALASAARRHGAEIETGCGVERILVRDGRAVGVVTEGGTELEAGLVVSGLDPKTTLLELGDPAWLDPEVTFAVRNLRSRGTVATLQLILDRLPVFPGRTADDGHLAGRIQIGGDLDSLERAFDRVKYGELPDEPLLEITLPSVTDPGQAPNGRHLMHVWVQHAAHDLRGESWDDHRERLVEVVVEAIERLVPGFGGTIVDRRVRTPLDLERDFGLTGGCLYHVEPALDSMLFLRPFAGWYQYRTPVAGLYLCGPGTHPGGGVTGLPGKNAATQLLEDGRR